VYSLNPRTPRNSSNLFSASCSSQRLSVSAVKFHSCEETAHFYAPAAHVLIDVYSSPMLATHMRHLSRLGLSLCAASMLAATGAPSPDAALSQARTALARLPLRFEANRGQWDPAVRYAARANGYALLLTAGGPVVAFPGSQRVAIRLLDSNPAAPIEALDPLPSHTDYFLGSRDRWHTGVPNYSRVRYGAVYPGIDVVYYGNPSRLEYDFVLPARRRPWRHPLELPRRRPSQNHGRRRFGLRIGRHVHVAREARDLSTGRRTATRRRSRGATC